MSVQEYIIDFLIENQPDDSETLNELSDTLVEKIVKMSPNDARKWFDYMDKKKLLDDLNIINIFCRYPTFDRDFLEHVVGKFKEIKIWKGDLEDLIDENEKVVSDGRLELVKQYLTVTLSSE